MHESAARAAVAINEWVDRLELRMCDRGLHNSGERIVVAEAAEVFEEIAYEIRWRWDERGRAGVVVAATDPILLGADGASVGLQRSASEQSPMEAQQVVQGDGITRSDAADSRSHSVNVPQHLGRGDVGRLFAKTEGCLCPEETPGTDLQAFDA